MICYWNGIGNCYRNHDGFSLKLNFILTTNDREHHAHNTAHQPSCKNKRISTFLRRISRICNNSMDWMERLFSGFLQEEEHYFILCFKKSGRKVIENHITYNVGMDFRLFVLMRVVMNLLFHRKLWKDTYKSKLKPFWKDEWHFGGIIQTRFSFKRF